MYFSLFLSFSKLSWSIYLTGKKLELVTREIQEVKRSHSATNTQNRAPQEPRSKAADREKTVQIISFSPFKYQGFEGRISQLRCFLTYDRKLPRLASAQWQKGDMMHRKKNKQKAHFLVSGEIRKWQKGKKKKTKKTTWGECLTTFSPPSHFIFRERKR